MPSDLFPEKASGLELNVYIAFLRQCASKWLFGLLKTIVRLIGRRGVKDFDSFPFVDPVRESVVSRRCTCDFDVASLFARDPLVEIIVYPLYPSVDNEMALCNRRKFYTRFNFVFFGILAKSTKFSSIRKLCTCTSVSDTALTARKLLAYEHLRTQEFEISTRTKIFFLKSPNNCPKIRKVSVSRLRFT